jgi:hypothetical protein
MLLYHTCKDCKDAIYLAHMRKQNWPLFYIVNETVSDMSTTETLPILNEAIIERLSEELGYGPTVQRRPIEIFDKTKTLLSRNNVVARALASVHLAAREVGVGSMKVGKYQAVAKEAFLEPTAA